MGKVIVEAIIILALPTIAFVSGGWLMSEISGRDYVRQRLRMAADSPDRKPLNQRLSYDIGAVQRHLAALDQKALQVEQHFLELDLIFPFLYGATLAFSLFMTWSAIGRPFHPAWLLAPVVITLLADWTENLVLLNQIKSYLIGGAASLESGWVRVASIATALKLLFFSGASLLLVSLVLVMLVRASKSS